MSTLCELSDLPVDQCACRIHDPETVNPAHGVTPREARFNGVCVECREAIAPGDLIVGALIGWLHRECQ
jgi:hypothetical protein